MAKETFNFPSKNCQHHSKRELFANYGISSTFTYQYSEQMDEVSENFNQLVLQKPVGRQVPSLSATSTVLPLNSKCKDGKFNLILLHCPPPPIFRASKIQREYFLWNEEC
ncbi:hypothetical protein DPMN_111006 [Dreissena polymorpha]|uniref:Uncharacterized protein n=1 Tax=Dreissena polymorpha TaxID=45954 RepID=A0A9D4KDQ8_DREPO|nr:hypothetical protein DPMN_111006 [Dreissena polymorpha]